VADYFDDKVLEMTNIMWKKYY